MTVCRHKGKVITYKEGILMCLPLCLTVNQPCRSIGKGNILWYK